VFNSAATTLNYVVSTPAGLTKYGSSTLTLGAANTFGTALTINGGLVNFSADNQLGAAANPIVFGLRTNAVSPPRTGIAYTGTNLLFLNRNITLNSYGALSAPAVGSPNPTPLLVLNGNITGVGAIGTNTIGSAYEFNGANTFQGDVFVDQGLLSISG